MWTDNYKQRSYLTITAHWINSKWELVSYFMCTEKFDSTKSGCGYPQVLRVWVNICECWSDAGQRLKCRCGYWN